MPELEPDISVVVPTFRRRRELAQAIDSALAQRGPRVEIVVVDDCPDGSARDVAAPFAARGVRYVRNSAPSGGRPALVRNFGWKLARGEVVHFLDDDDVVPEGCYADAMAAFAAHPSVGVAYGEVAPFGTGDVASEQAYFQRGTARARSYRRFGGRLGLAAGMLFGPAMFVCSAAMIRRRCIAPLGGFDPGLALCEDVDFYARAIRRYGAVALDRVSINYRIGPSLMHRPDRDEPLLTSYRAIHSRYRAAHGRLDFLALKSLARVVGAMT